ncbi:MAG: 16S rRNA (guanine(527)-N(7))-methyltransferase RsmG [bacterium]|nr:16S rRNA (guanine(527)-N(7))-methyltransferase RsmG [bacterium]
MIRIKDEIKKMYNFTPEDSCIFRLEVWRDMFVDYNSHTNLMSKNDVSLLYEKHVLDSLSLVLFDGFKDGIKLLDVWCGGGFPSIILAIFFPNVEIVAMDSIGKKTTFLKLVRDKLSLHNFEVINSRIENYPPLNADIITNRAVGKISDVWNFSKKHLKNGGYFVSYKALTAKEEAKNASDKFKELGNLKFIPYNLPLSENFVRELVVFQKR